MNQTGVTILAGFVAGLVGGYFGQSLAVGGRQAPNEPATSEVTALRAAVDELQHEVRVLRNPPETLAAGRSAPMRAEAGEDGLELTAEAQQALLARVDERVAAAVDEKLEALKEAGASGREGRREGRKKMTLAEAAAELELSGQQEDELRRIYEESERKMLALLAEPDGDPEEIRREIQDAVKTPAGAGKMIGKYMPKVIGRLGEVIAMQAEREAAIVKTLGPEKAKRLENEFQVKEGEFLGLGGGGMNIGASVDVEGR